MFQENSPVLLNGNDNVRKTAKRISFCKYKNEIISVLTVCLGPLSLGLTINYSSPALVDLENERLISETLSGWFAALTSAGAAVSCLLGGYCIEKLGRKTTILLSSLPMVIGWLILLINAHVSMLLIGRFLNGFSVGIISVATPVYIGEIVSANLRGLMLNCFQLLIVIGTLLTFSLSIVLRWQWLAIFNSCVSTLIVIVVVPLVPESPVWLLKHGYPLQAMENLTWLRNDDTLVATQEYTIMENAVRQTTDNVSIREILSKKRYLKPLLLSIMLMLFQQFCGVNAIQNFAEQIFYDAGISNAVVASIFATVVSIVFTLIACFLIDFTGRRLLLIASSLIMTISHLVLGLSFYFKIEKDDQNISWLSIVGVLLFQAGFSLGWGPIPWTILGEIFPSSARGIASGISSTTNWVFSFIVVVSFLPMKATLHPYGTFWFFGAICLISSICVSIALPETKGKTLNEIEKLFI